MIDCQSQIRVRYVETDAGGVAHHSSFVPWLEIARIDLLDKIGLPYVHIENQNIDDVVLEIHLKILKPAFFDDRLMIKICMLEIPKVKHKFNYEIFRNNSLIATAETLHAFVNKEKKKAIKPPSNFMSAIKPYFSGN